MKPAGFLALLFCLTLASSPLVAQTDEECLTCHGEQGLTMTKGGKEISLSVDRNVFRKSVHADLGCVSCHEGFNPSELPHARRIKPVDCTGCHSDSQYVNFAMSIHANPKTSGKQRLRCADCHRPHAVERLTGADAQARQKFVMGTCARCHATVNAKFMASDHGVGLAAGVPGAPTCVDCHDEHQAVAVADTTSPTSRVREAAMCLGCHLDNPDVKAVVGPSAGFIAGYERSVHARAMKDGNDLAATCSDCHGSHEMRKASNPESRVNKLTIAVTCGGCHLDIQAEYAESAHGTSLAKGVLQSATCTDCHGEHVILAHDDPTSPIASINVSGQVCKPCHESVTLTQKYGLAGDRFRTFEDSYHGLAGRAGSVEAANCASCHGVHSIRSSSDPMSSIHKDNLPKTCGECHPGATANFAKGTVHVIAAESEDDLLRWVAATYIVLITVTIGGMAFHNIVDFYRKSRTQLEYRRGVRQRPHHGNRLYLRMSFGERVQHGLLLTSFITLVLTGFALRFPDAWWVAPFRQISPWMFELRGIVHRVAGVILIVVSLYHAYYLFAVPSGKRLLKDMLPVNKDLLDFIGVLAYNVGIRDEKPLLDRFSYVEKAEYWALIWGTAVMSITGIILWFDNTFLGLLTKLGWDVARAIHYYEAWLATLAIIVWHFYFVIFNPSSYPLNLAFWKGTLTEEEMEDEHPAELRRILQAERQAEEERRVADEAIAAGAAATMPGPPPQRPGENT
jgi:predicted CXXCH cytochrome family protein